MQFKGPMTTSRDKRLEEQIFIKFMIIVKLGTQKI